MDSSSNELVPITFDYNDEEALGQFLINNSNYEDGRARFTRIAHYGAITYGIGTFCWASIFILLGLIPNFTSQNTK